MKSTLNQTAKNYQNLFALDPLGKLNWFLKQLWDHSRTCLPK